MPIKIKALGFTLIEMLVVISIIGILATLVAANLNSARSRARDAERKSDLRSIQTSLRAYYNDNGAYPSNAVFNNGSWNSGLKYMNTVPQDPLPSQNYVYALQSDTDSYKLSACLENNSDPQGVAAASTFSFTCTKMFQISQ